MLSKFMCRNCCRPISVVDFVKNHFAQKHPNSTYSMEDFEVLKTFKCPVCLKDGININFPFPLRCHLCYTNSDKDDIDICVFGLFSKEKELTNQ
jgi:hypothetical protein